MISTIYGLNEWTTPYIVLPVGLEPTRLFRSFALEANVSAISPWKLAAEAGIEPTLSVSKTALLPLEDSAMFVKYLLKLFKMFDLDIELRHFVFEVIVLISSYCYRSMFAEDLPICTTDERQPFVISVIREEYV